MPRQEKTTINRHCMIVHAYYPLGETRVEREAQVLRDNGYEVDVLCLRRPAEQSFESSNRINIHRLPVGRHKERGLVGQMFEYLGFFTLVFLKLFFLYPRRKYGIVQVHNVPDFLVFSAFLPKLFGARLILDIHDLMPEFFANLKSLQNAYLHRLVVRMVILQEQLSCRFADHVITVSEHWRQTLISRGVPTDKCSVVMNVADERIFKWSSDFASYSRKNDRFRLIYHGTIVYRYGLDLAIQAVSQLVHDIPDIELVILGKGDYVETLAEMVHAHGLEQYVTIHNELRPAQELPELIRTADLGIVPYRNDTFTNGLLPTKLMEYAALGLPAVAARTTAIEKYFADTMVAFFEPGDVNSLTRCIRDLYKTPGRLKELAQGSRIFNERFNWISVGSEYTALVSKLNKRVAE